MKIIRAFLAADCPINGIIKFERCKRCTFNDYEALTEHAVECSYHSSETTIIKGEEK